MKLAFSTLACPEWTWRQVIERARELGYDGVEWRLVDGRMIDINFPIELAADIGMASERSGLSVPALDSSVELAAPPGPRRERIIRDACQLMHVARAFGAEFLRVFVGRCPESATDETVIGWMRESLRALQPVARETGVRVAVELHGLSESDRPRTSGITCSRFMAEVLRSLDMPEVGVQWDLGNPYLEGEPAARTWQHIRPWLLYLQMKDMIRTADGAWSQVPMGKGELPVRDIIEWIGGRHFGGWASFEWEKWWHPELAEPGTVLPGYIAYMTDYR